MTPSARALAAGAIWLASLCAACAFDLQGHSGARGLAPENTLPAFANALSIGSEVAILVAALLVAGALTGLLAGLFGVGGGAVIVPVLYELFRIAGVPEDARMPLCIGTSLAVIIPTSIRAFVAHRAKGAVDGPVLRAWALPLVVGVVAASAAARYAPPEVFKATFVLVAGLMAFRLFFKRESWRFGGDIPFGPLMHTYGVVIGALSTLMGIGGGALATMVMTSYGRSIHQAIGTSSGIGVLISVPGTLGYMIAGWPKAAQHPDVAALQLPMAIGYVSLVGFILFIPTSIWAAPIGARLAHRLSKRTLELAFGTFLLAMACRFAASLVLG
jgi:uncharacterized membrane protein YfcA